MRKILLTAIVVLLSIVSTNAQTFGVKAGLNYSGLIRENVDSHIQFKGLTGFYIGVATEVPIANIFSIQPELVYSRQGAKLDINIAGIYTGSSAANEEITLATHYINIPVFVKVNITEKFSLLGGPQMSFLISKPEVNTNFNSIALKKDYFTTFDFGIGIGGIYKLENGLFFEARYTHGFTNIFDEDNNKLLIIKDARNSVISVGLGFMF